MVTGSPAPAGFPAPSRLRRQPSPPAHRNTRCRPGRLLRCHEAARPRHDSALLYQLAFRTPGISPRSAISRKQIRQMPNFRRYALGRPQRWHRLWCRTPNFGFCRDRSIRAFLAITSRYRMPVRGSGFTRHRPRRASRPGRACPSRAAAPSLRHRAGPSSRSRYPSRGSCRPCRTRSRGKSTAP